MYQFCPFGSSHYSIKSEVMRSNERRPEIGEVLHVPTYFGYLFANCINLKKSVYPSMFTAFGGDSQMFYGSKTAPLPRPQGQRIPPQTCQIVANGCLQ